jgi:hypothetical protein
MNEYAMSLCNEGIRYIAISLTLPNSYENNLNCSLM